MNVSFEKLKREHIYESPLPPSRCSSSWLTCSIVNIWNIICWSVTFQELTIAMFPSFLFVFRLICLLTASAGIFDLYLAAEASRYTIFIKTFKIGTSDYSRLSEISIIRAYPWIVIAFFSNFDYSGIIEDFFSYSINWNGLLKLANSNSSWNTFPPSHIHWLPSHARVIPETWYRIAMSSLKIRFKSFSKCL